MSLISRNLQMAIPELDSNIDYDINHGMGIAINLHSDTHLCGIDQK